MEEIVKVLVDSLKSLKEIKDKSVKRAIISAVNIPVFNPKLDNHGAAKLCSENLAATFNWPDYELSIRYTTGLMGNVKKWFLRWKPDEKSWENFKTEISTLYPAKRNLSEKVRRVSLYTSDKADS